MTDISRQRAASSTVAKDTFFLYLLLCADGSLYTGITTDVTRRLKEHREGKGGHYTRARGAVKIVYTEEHENRGSALSREAEIKKWTRDKKLALLSHI